MFARLAMEPPFRILARAILARLNVSAETSALWELSSRPAYLLGVLQAAKQAKAQGVGMISVVEFGVAGGDGLVALQKDAERVERDTGITIRVFGFDAGGGLPELVGDYRDHPDVWQPGDYPMDIPKLRARLADRTRLILGNVRDTVKQFNGPPLGFVSFDLDLYSSTRDALQIFRHPMLWHVPLYFDDINFHFNHRYAGELLAIDEFNAGNNIKIDRWYGVKHGRPFPERRYLDQMYVAHDLTAQTQIKREVAVLPLRAGA